MGRGGGEKFLSLRFLPESLLSSLFPQETPYTHAEPMTDALALLLPLSYQASWELVTLRVRNLYP